MTKINIQVTEKTDSTLQEYKRNVHQWKSIQT